MYKGDFLSVFVFNFMCGKDVCDIFIEEGKCGWFENIIMEGSLRR